MQNIFQFLLLLLLLNNLFLLGASKITHLNRLAAFQGALLALALLALGHWALACAVLLIKAMALPMLLCRARRRISAEPFTRSRISYAVSVLAGMCGLAFSLWLEQRLPMTVGIFPLLLLPTALTTLFSGLILVVSRVTALSQVIGYLVAENGIFLLGIPLMTADTAWFELTLLLDVFVAVFVMGIAINHINKTFESIDVARFRSLRD